MASVPPSSEYPLRAGNSPADATGSVTSFWLASPWRPRCGAVVLLGAIVWKVIALAWPAITEYGIGFITSDRLGPGYAISSARCRFIYGTAITSLLALLHRDALAIAIALWLSELAPRGVRGIVGVARGDAGGDPERRARSLGHPGSRAFPRAPFEPWLHDKLGFIPIFGAPEATGTGMFTAAVILTIMVVPIVASICRELFLQVPNELEDGALALGATRWEMVRGVILPATRTGIAAAIILGLGRALGEAIAVTQVIGGGTRITHNVFGPSDTIASKIAASYQGAATRLEVSALLYLAAILMVIGLLTNLAAQFIVRRFDPLKDAR